MERNLLMVPAAARRSLPPWDGGSGKVTAATELIWVSLLPRVLAFLRVLNV